jgi:hypothetical protein
MNFVERQYILHFYSFGDIMAKLGGFRASIMPIVDWFGPFFVLFFLMSLAGIIKNNISKTYETELKDFIKTSENQF